VGAVGVEGERDGADGAAVPEGRIAPGAGEGGPLDVVTEGCERGVGMTPGLDRLGLDRVEEGESCRAVGVRAGVVGDEPGALGDTGEAGPVDGPTVGCERAVGFAPEPARVGVGLVADGEP
jgi:hypothetical protein